MIASAVTATAGVIASPGSNWQAGEPIGDCPDGGVEHEPTTCRNSRHAACEHVEQDPGVPGANSPDCPVAPQRQLVGDHRPARPDAVDVNVIRLRHEPALGTGRSSLRVGPTGVGPRQSTSYSVVVVVDLSAALARVSLLPPAAPVRRLAAASRKRLLICGIT